MSPEMKGTKSFF